MKLVSGKSLVIMGINMHEHLLTIEASGLVIGVNIGLILFLMIG